MVSSMKCEDCGEQFANWDASKIHQCQHEKSKETRRNMERKDVLLHTESKRKAGDDCEDGDQDLGGKEEVCLAKLTDAVETDSLVALQIEEKKPIYGTSQRVYVCGICGKVYSYLESFRNHHKQHRDKCEKPNQFTCVYCGKQYRHASGLSCHMKVHKNDHVPSALKCDQCNKIFHSHQTWSTHREIHRKKPFWCLSCAKGFKDSKGLDRHLIGHNLKRHKCDVCSKTFRVPAELRYHYNTHTGAKPYSCALCRKTFSQLGNLITHRKKHVRVYKEGSMTPLGSKPRQLAGKRRVSVLKKLIVTGAGELEEASAGVSENPEEVTDEEGMEAEIDECPDEQEEQLRCHECSALFSRESDLHQHYMKHASGEM